MIKSNLIYINSNDFDHQNCLIRCPTNKNEKLYTNVCGNAAHIFECVHPIKQHSWPCSTSVTHTIYKTSIDDAARPPGRPPAPTHTTYMNPTWGDQVQEVKSKRKKATAEYWGGVHATRRESHVYLAVFGFNELCNKTPPSRDDALDIVSIISYVDLLLWCGKE